jgi:hypothetical protein
MNGSFKKVKARQRVKIRILPLKLSEIHKVSSSLEEKANYYRLAKNKYFLG